MVSAYAGVVVGTRPLLLSYGESGIGILLLVSTLITIGSVVVLAAQGWIVAFLHRLFAKASRKTALILMPLLTFFASWSFIALFWQVALFLR
ncbi:hypothetical protein [Propionivibrio dicarboxylicus]|uniref:Yip1 domain-containing protein n=1 Tax=Propionivibrio dicarboxylicus TaxID=83767 RepID=A0A1G8EL53_9RHOO|nr:hypothetical protein [Propionivibrio dicarboxylicus]SDH70673.1 hypothetical protein SAMN05660652_02119 [Propionivibrio dicarboxylicus]